MFRKVVDEVLMYRLHLQHHFQEVDEAWLLNIKAVVDEAWLLNIKAVVDEAWLLNIKAVVDEAWLLNIKAAVDEAWLLNIKAVVDEVQQIHRLNQIQIIFKISNKYLII
jgi:hypothetical protein